MCGYIGYFTRDGQINDSGRRAALDTIAHRGPDDEGMEQFRLGPNELCLGHRRLSIIDLTPNGHQPFFDASRQCVMVYNGEVYNYRELRDELIGLGYAFHTDSDTEVVLAAWKTWGDAAWSKCIGMFSLVIYDLIKEELILVRDAFGIKPLYYSQTEEGFFFGSEIKALQKLVSTDFTLNTDRAFSYLIWSHYDFGNETFFKEVKQLMPAHSMRFNLLTKECSTPFRWWWPSIKENSHISYQDAVTKLRDLFTDSVRIHLRSDVSLGVALSGGVDSSSVTCAIKAIEPDMQINTFSYIAKDSILSEENWVDVVNTATGAESAKVYVHPVEMTADLEDLVKTLGEPFGSTSIYAQYRVFKLVKEKGVTVTLDGQGADELLAGYWGYPNDRVRTLLRTGNWFSLGRFLLNWGNWPGRSRKQALGILFQELAPKSLSLRMKVRKHGLVPEWLAADSLTAEPLVFARPLFQDDPEASGRHLAHALRVDLINGGLQSLLRHGDRNSMRWQVESRVPFLTIPLVEFMLSLPESYLISLQGETKRIFKSAMRGIVPDAILDRRDKIGFSTPESTWLRQVDWSNWIKPDVVKAIPFIKEEVLMRTLESQLNGTARWQSQTWRILNFVKWYELNFVNSTKL